MNGINVLSNDSRMAMNGEKTMSSREIAELMGKRHDHVMRDIKVVLGQAEIEASKFTGIYLDKYKREKPCYNLSYKAAMLVLSGFGVHVREKVLDSLSLLHLYELLEGLDVAGLPDDRFVYVAMEANSKRFKVGISKDPIARVKQLNIGNPEQLVLVHAYLATEEGNMSESLAHSTFKDNALRSEWFDEDSDLEKLPSYSA